MIASLSASILHNEGSQAEQSITPSFMCVSDLCAYVSEVYCLSHLTQKGLCHMSPCRMLVILPVRFCCPLAWGQVIVCGSSHICTAFVLLVFLRQAVTGPLACIKTARVLPKGIRFCYSRVRSVGSVFRRAWDRCYRGSRERHPVLSGPCSKVAVLSWWFLLSLIGEGRVR